MSGNTGTCKPMDLFSATGIVYAKGPDLLTDARAIIDAAQASAYRAVNVALVYRNWLLGRRIAEEDFGAISAASTSLCCSIDTSRFWTHCAQNQVDCLDGLSDGLDWA